MQAARLVNGWSQRQAAELVPYTQSKLRAMEQGRLAVPVTSSCAWTTWLGRATRSTRGVPRPNRRVGSSERPGDLGTSDRGALGPERQVHKD